MSSAVPAKPRRNLASAIVVGLALGALFIASLVIEKQFFMVFIAVFVGFGVWELATISRNESRHVPRIPVLISAIGMIPATYYFGPLGQLLSLAVGIAFTLVWHLVQRWFSKQIVTDRDMIMTAFSLAYVPFLASFAILTLGLDGGEWWVLGTVVIIASIDTGALASGMLLGKTPMAPSISPNKTWEGFAGSVLAAVIAGILISTLMLDHPWWIGVMLGLVLVATSTGGDLIESLIKRELGTKDASSFLPGHGGFLDRLDSVLPGVMVGYVFALFFT